MRIKSNSPTLVTKVVVLVQQRDYEYGTICLVNLLLNLAGYEEAERT